VVQALAGGHQLPLNDGSIDSNFLLEGFVGARG
jgi:hypothetical protein